MKLSRKLIFTLIVLILPVVIVGMYVALAFVFSRIQASQVEFEGLKDKVIYVHTNGVHLDIALNKKDVNGNLLKQIELKENQEFVSFGWGDRGFYLKTPEWKDLKVKVAFNAMFVPSKTAMHVTRYKDVKSHWIPVRIGEKQLEILNKYINKSFVLKNSKVRELKNTGGYGADDSFYKANKTYHLIRTCNMWVNNALKEIGIPTSVWCPFDWGVLYFLKKKD